MSDKLNDLMNKLIQKRKKYIMRKVNRRSDKNMGLLNNVKSLSKMSLERFSMTHIQKVK